MGKTAIEWTDLSSNPIRAVNTHTGRRGWYCVKKSPGCAGCYAESMNLWRGTGVPYSVARRGDVEIILDRAELDRLVRLKQPARVFPCDMTDLFGEFVPERFIDEVFAAMALSPRLTYQVLTKRPDRMAAYLADPHTFARIEMAADLQLQRVVGLGTFLSRDDWPLPNVWLGTSVERQQEADERIPHLLRCPVAAVRFLSIEPMLEAVSVWTAIGLFERDGGQVAGWTRANPHYFHWAILGGESDQPRHKARPIGLGDFRATRDLLQEAGVPVFVKQLGSVWAKTNGAKHRKGGDPEEWPADLRVREFPVAIEHA